MADIAKIRDLLQDRVATEVAKKTGLNRKTVQAIKNGKASGANPATLKVLADYLGAGHDE